MRNFHFISLLLVFCKCFQFFMKLKVTWLLIGLIFTLNDKNLARTKLKAFVDNKLNVAEILIFVLDKVNNIVGYRENTT